MLDTLTVSTIFGFFAGIGILVAGSGYAYAQYKRGGSDADVKTIISLREYIETLEDKNKRLSEEKSQLINSHQVQITELTKNMGVLQGRFDEQAKQVEMYTKILQGRDPEMMAVLGEIKELLKRLDIKSLVNQKRNESIDKASATTSDKKPVTN